MSRPSTRPSTTKWKPAVLRGLGNREVVAVLKITAFSAFTLLKAVAASIT